MQPEHELQWLPRGECSLALHAWRAASPRAAIFYVHGLQSHGGWLFETGPALRALGVSVFVLDRRGAGQSSGPRGDAASGAELVNDSLAALLQVRAEHPDLPLTLMGQSFGGSLAAAVACESTARHDALLLCAPGLGRLHHRVPQADQAELLRTRPQTLVPVPLRDEWYTSDPRFLDFIRADPLMLRETTGRFLAAGLELEDRYRTLDAPVAGKPSAMVLARRDPIVDPGLVRAAYERLAGRSGVVLELDSDEHYFEFSRWRRPLIGWVAAFAIAGGFGVPA